MFLVALTLVRLAVAAGTPLAPDEAYYWVWSRAPALSYLDHPPMVALFVRFGTALAGASPVGIRLAAPLAAAMGSCLLACAGRDIFGYWRIGLGAAWMVNATLMFGIGSVTMTPDTPLLLFWTATIAALGRLLATGRGNWWLAAGASAGLALDSKLTAALLFPAVGAWSVCCPAIRPWLRTWYPWAATVLALGLFVPILAWNASHRWVGFIKQGARAGDWHPIHAARFMAELAIGQAGLATPLVFAAFVAGTIWSVKRWRAPGPGLVAWLVCVPATVLLQHAAGGRVQANWPAMIYPAAALAGAAMPCRDYWRRRTIALGFGFCGLVWMQAAMAPLPLPLWLDPTLMRVGGWRALAASIETVARQRHAAFVAADNYGQAAMLALLLPGDIPVLGAEARWREFGLPSFAAGRTGLLLHSARRAAPSLEGWAGLVGLGALARERNGAVAEWHELYRVKATSDRAEMPRP